MTDRSQEPLDSTPTGLIQWDSSWPELAVEPERNRLFSYLEERFGIPHGLFKEYLLVKRAKTWILIKADPQINHATKLKVLRVGLRAFEEVGSFIKPTTRMIQVFGHAATRARLEINETQLMQLWEGRQMNLDLDLDKGYVILSLGKDAILGLGFYADGRLSSQLPRRELGKAMWNHLEV